MVIALTVLMSVVTVGVTSVSAKNVSTVSVGATSGKTGDCTWKYDKKTYTLTISGKGKMENYCNEIGGIERYLMVPWEDYLDEIKSVVVEEGVTTIGNQSFYYCENLRNVKLADSIKTIGKYAFSHCSELTKITLGKNVTRIEDSAFFASLKLEEVKLSDKLQYIGTEAFCYCKSLKSISMPDTVTEMGWGAFDTCENLTSVKLSKNISEIQGQTFRYCPFKKIILPEKLKEIEAEAFFECDLTSITLPDTVKVIRSSAFEDCRSLKTVKLSNKLTKIGERAFYDCFELKSIVIPDSVTSIESQAFSGCSLTKLTMSKNIKEVGQSALSGSNIYDDKNWKDGVLYFDKILIVAKSSVKKCNVKKGTRVISSNAFETCKKLTSVSIPGSVVNIGTEAFSGCVKLNKITMKKGTKKIQERAFYNCKKLTSINIPDTVTTMEDEVFYNTGIKTIKLPENLKNFSGKLFYGSDISKIKDSSKNKYITVIDGNIYSKDKKTFIYYLASKDEDRFNIPSGVKFILDYSFYKNRNLYSVVLPKSVEKIDFYAFYEMSCLKKAYYRGSKADWKKINIITCLNDFGDDACGNESLLIAKRYYNYKCVEQKISAKDVTKYATKKYGKKTFKLKVKAKTGLTFESSNKKVAVVSKKGVVTLKKFGKAKITIKAKENKKYQSATKKITVSYEVRPADEKTVKIKKSKLSWKKVSNVSGYKVTLYTEYKGKKTKTTFKQTSTKYSIKNLKKGMTVTAKICTYREIGKKTYYSSPLKKVFKI